MNHPASSPPPRPGSSPAGRGTQSSSKGDRSAPLAGGIEKLPAAPSNAVRLAGDGRLTTGGASPARGPAIVFAQLVAAHAGRDYAEARRLTSQLRLLGWSVVPVVVRPKAPGGPAA